MRNAVKAVSKMLEGARRESNVEHLQCLTNRLTAIRALVQVSETAEVAMKDALSAGESERADHEFRKIAVALTKTRQLLAEAERCMDDPDLRSGDTKLKVEIDGCPTGKFTCDDGSCKDSELDCGTEFDEFSPVDLGFDAAPPPSSSTCKDSEYKGSDGACKKVSTCSASQYEVTAPTATSDRACKATTTCKAGEYVSKAATATSDTVCAVVTTCPSGQYASKAATATSNTVCSAVTTCPTGEYEVSAPTATKDRVCKKALEAKNLSFTVDEDDSVEIDVLANDSDIDGDQLTVSKPTGAGNGKVTIKDNKFTYTPNANFNGADSFTYTLNDGNGGSATGTVSITVNSVNDAPVVKKEIPDQEITAGEKLSIDVYGAFSDADGDVLTITGKGLPEGAVLTGVQRTEKFFMTRDWLSDIGEHTITITADDKKGGKVSTSFKLTVKPKPKPQIEFGELYADDDNTRISKPEGGKGETTTFKFPLKLTGFPLKEKVTVHYSVAPDENTLGKLSQDDIVGSLSSEVTIPAGAKEASIEIVFKGNDKLEGDKHFSVAISGAESASYKGIVKQAGENTVYAFIEEDDVKVVNTPPFATDDAQTISADSKSTVINVLNNDTDPDKNDKLTVSNIVKKGTKGYLVLSRNGVISYDPNNEFNDLEKGKTDTDTFTYTVSDGKGGTDTATVTITVNGVKEKPVPVDCVVSDWSEFSECSKSCGGGTQTRTRTISVKPENGGKECPVLTESKVCNTESCPTKSVTTCPATTPIECPDGRCKLTQTECGTTTQSLTSNQCSAPTPFKCADGSCKALQADCPTSASTNTCPATTPIKCPDSSCKVSQAECPTSAPPTNTCPATTPIECPDGSCKLTQTECGTTTQSLTSNQCSAPTPFKCADGSCKALQADCPTKTTQTPTTSANNVLNDKNTDTNVVKKVVSISKGTFSESDKKLIFTITLSCPDSHPVECSANTCCVKGPSGGSVAAKLTQVGSEDSTVVSAEGWVDVKGNKDNLSYAWSATCEGGLGNGVFGGNEAVTTWTAPLNITEKAQPCILSVEVKDIGNGGTTTVTIPGVVVNSITVSDS